MTTTVEKITRHNGVAGQYTLTAKVRDEYGTREASFVGSAYGGPVVLVYVAENGTEVQTFVSNPERHGPFGPEWVRRFFAE